MLDRAFYIPEYIEPRKHLKGNGGHTGNMPGHHNPKYNSKGVFYQCGMGCHRHENCFTCNLEPCTFNSGRKGKSDLQFMTRQEI